MPLEFDQPTTGRSRLSFDEPTQDVAPPPSRIQPDPEPPLGGARFTPRGMFGLPPSVTGGFERGVVGGTAGLIGGALENISGPIGRAGAELSRFGIRETRQAEREAPVTGTAGAFLPYALPVGRAMQAATVPRRIVSGAATTGALGYLSPTGEQDEAKREQAKRSAAGLGILFGGAIPAGGALAGGLYKYGRNLYNRLTGREIAEAGRGLTSGVEEVATGAATRAVGETEAASRALQQAQQTEQRQAAARPAAETAQKAATERERLAGRRLAGVRSEEEFGQYGLVPRTLNEVGDYVRTQATRFIESIKEARRTRADREITQARAAAEAREASQPFALSEEMRALAADIEKRLSTETEQGVRNQLQRVYQSLFQGAEGVTPSFASSETVRRRLGDAAFGVPAEGYEAIGQNIARDLYRKLSDAMKTYEPSFARYLENYKRLSEPLEVANTRLGRAIMGTERDAPSFFAATGEQIANSAFRNPESVRALSQAVGGNKQILNAAAERYFANRLVGKSAEEMRKILTEDKTRAVLRELGPEFRARLNERIFQPALQQARRGTAAGQRVTEINQAVQKSATEIKALESRIREMVPRAREIGNGLADIQAAVGSVARNEAASRLAERLKKLPDVDAPTRAQLDRLVNELKQAHERQSEARKLLLKLGLGGGGLGLGYQAYRNL